jgi:hypothetical protein
MLKGALETCVIMFMYVSRIDIVCLSFCCLPVALPVCLVFCLPGNVYCYHSGLCCGLCRRLRTVCSFLSVKGLHISPTAPGCLGGVHTISHACRPSVLLQLVQHAACVAAASAPLVCSQVTPSCEFERPQHAYLCPVVLC